MNMKDAYKQAFTKQINLLKEKGKITLLDTAENLAEDFYNAFKDGLKEGAALSKETWDDVAVSFLPTLDKIVDPLIDRINPED